MRRSGQTQTVCWASTENSNICTNPFVSQERFSAWPGDQGQTLRVLSEKTCECLIEQKKKNIYIFNSAGMHGSLLPCTIIQSVSCLQQIYAFCTLEYILLLLDCFRSFKHGLKSCCWSVCLVPFLSLSFCSCSVNFQSHYSCLNVLGKRMLITVSIC